MTKPCPPDLAAFKHEPADYEQPVEAVTVEQCDRDLWKWLLDAPYATCTRIDNLPDDCAELQRIARHRTQANETMRLREALDDAIAALEGRTPDLDEAICCSGHDCGCRGSSHRELLLYNLRAALSGDSARPQANETMREALEDIALQAETRIKDGDEMGARCWRIGLVDILAEARRALSGDSA